MGSIDHPFNPAALALGADATFVARGLDRDPAHLQHLLLRSHQHKGSAFLEIYQNCNIFNDGAFELFTDKGSKKMAGVYVQHDQPLVFGENDEYGVRLDGFKPVSVKLGEEFSKDDLWVHDETDIFKAQILTRIFEQTGSEEHLPRPFGVFYATERPTYEDMLNEQLQQSIDRHGNGDLDLLLRGNETWEIE
jgi:2-oxoglutarate ferredoxin oxidoreductase subunit beta